MTETVAPSTLYVRGLSAGWAATGQSNILRANAAPQLGVRADDGHTSATSPSGRFSTPVSDTPVRV